MGGGKIASTVCDGLAMTGETPVLRDRRRIGIRRYAGGRGSASWPLRGRIRRNSPSLMGGGKIASTVCDGLAMTGETPVLPTGAGSESDATRAEGAQQAGPYAERDWRNSPSIMEGEIASPVCDGLAMTGETPVLPTGGSESDAARGRGSASWPLRGRD